ncbi:MAG: hypothetical protein LUG24_01935 [Clostridiales bacterium]|nr:hypothetical protein [Clostridiales bacterium]
MSLSGIVMTASAEVLNVPFVKIFTDYDERLFNMTCHGFISAAISLLRTLLFQIVY